MTDEPGTDPGQGRVADGAYVYGVVRVRGWRPGRGADAELHDLQRVRFRDLEALVRPVRFEMPRFDDEQLRAHQRTVEAIMRGGTVLPFPYGIVFRGRRQLVTMLQEQYLALDEGLALLDGHWELRLHLALEHGAEPNDAASALAASVYSELRRGARAAVPFPVEGKRLLSAAFLVDHAGWVEFVERCEEFGRSHPELDFDVTGPWPAYDFVQIR